MKEKNLFLIYTPLSMAPKKGIKIISSRTDTVVLKRSFGNEESVLDV